MNSTVQTTQPRAAGEAAHSPVDILSRLANADHEATSCEHAAQMLARFSEEARAAIQLKASTGQAAHTPTPWRTLAGQILGHSEWTRKGTHGPITHTEQHIATLHSNLGSDCNDIYNFPPEREAVANAAFIVRACNSHAALVEALEEIAAQKTTAEIEADERALLDDSGTYDFDAAYDQCVMRARATLQLAKECR